MCGSDVTPDCSQGNLPRVAMEEVGNLSQTCDENKN